VLGGISYGRINFGVVLGGAPGCLPCLFRRGAPLNLPVRRGVQILRAEGIGLGGIVRDYSLVG
jgi:hypothetical protein